MARAPDERVSKAYELYKQGMKLVEIASQLNLPDGTVRRWKSTYKWDSERSEKKSERSHKNDKKKEAVASEVESVMSNGDLNDKQRLFCLYYSRTFNATKSYQKAYGCTYATALVNGPTLLGNTRVREQIMKLKEQRYSQALLKPEDIFQKYLEIAHADMTDFTTFGTKEIEYVDKAGNEHTTNVSYVEINESAEVDGTLISEISQGRDGVKVKLADRMKALQWLTDHMDMATEEQKAKLQLMRAQIDNINKDKDTGEGGVIIVNDIPRPN